MQMLNVGYVQHDGDWNWKNVCSPFTRIYFVTEGSAKVHMADRIVELKPDHMYVIPAYTEHSYECSGKFTHYYLHTFEVNSGSVSLMDYFDLPSEVEGSEIYRGIFRKMCNDHPEAILPSSDPQSYDNTTTFKDYVSRAREMPYSEKMMLQGCISILFSPFFKEAYVRLWAKDKRMVGAINYINQNICNKITLDDLAAHVYVTKPYIIRLFNSYFDISPLQYINKKKIERAQFMLTTENVSVKEIAYSLGFNDNSYFNRMFRKVSCCTPKEYRSEMRGEMLSGKASQ